MAKSNDLQYYISRAEIAYKSGQTLPAIKAAQNALSRCRDTEVSVSLRIFIARAYSKLGKFSESNVIYRTLIKENIYLPPVIMGLLYNSFKASDEKTGSNLRLIKIFVR